MRVVRTLELADLAEPMLRASPRRWLGDELVGEQIEPDADGVGETPRFGVLRLRWTGLEGLATPLYAIDRGFESRKRLQNPGHCVRAILRELTQIDLPSGRHSQRG